MTISTDEKLADYACSRYDHAYPSIVNGDERLGDPANRNFQFQSCSGAVTTDVIGKQIPNIDNAQQVILLSAGIYYKCYDEFPDKLTQRPQAGTT